MTNSHCCHSIHRNAMAEDKDNQVVLPIEDNQDTGM